MIAGAVDGCVAAVGAADPGALIRQRMSRSLIEAITDFDGRDTALDALGTNGSTRHVSSFPPNS